MEFLTTDKILTKFFNRFILGEKSKCVLLWGVGLGVTEGVGVGVGNGVGVGVCVQCVSNPFGAA